MAYNGIFITRESILFAVCRDERKASFALLQNNNGIFILASRIWSEYSISIVGITGGERKKEEEFWNIYILSFRVFLGKSRINTCLDSTAFYRISLGIFFNPRLRPGLPKHA